MKKILLVLISFLVAGCTIDYNLTIDNDTIMEEASIIIPIDEVDDYDSYQSQINYERPVYFEDRKIYAMTSKEDDNNYYVTYKFKHDIENYSKSSFLNTCYDSNNITITDDTISISTSNVFKCISMEDGYRAEKADIKITTKLKVLDNNADEIKENTYIWHMNSYEYSYKPINITMQKQLTQKKVAEDINNLPNKEIIIISIILIIIAIILYFFIKRREKNNNKF